MYVPSTYTPFAPWKFSKSLQKSRSFSNTVDFKSSKTSHVHTAVPTVGSAIKNLGLFSKSPGDFKMETMDF